MRFLLFLLTFFVTLTCTAQKYFLFIGTYTGTGSKGIYVYQFDATTNKATWISNTNGVTNPSYLAIAPGDSTLYACNETKTANGGGVSAFRFNKTAGTLRFMNKQTSGGDDPAYVTVHKGGKWVTAGNYSGGSLAAFATNRDGSLKPFSQLIKHTGRSVDPNRQTAPHVHATVFSPQGDYLFVPDLGIDKVMIYKFDTATASPLQPGAQPSVSATPGAGPRHFDFHPNGKWAYLIEEMGGAVVAYNYSNGRLTKFQEIISHSGVLTGTFASADIHVSPDGKFLYASNRGNENNIAIFKIDQTNGKLSTVGYESTMGKTPRNFCIDPSGNFLLVANQETNNIVIFKRNSVTGLLTPTGDQITILSPVCLKMIKR